MVPPAPETEASYMDVLTTTSLMLSGAGIATAAKSWAVMSFASMPLICRLFCDVRAPFTEKFGELRPRPLLSVRAMLTPGASAAN